MKGGNTGGKHLLAVTVLSCEEKTPAVTYDSIKTVPIVCKHL